MCPWDMCCFGLILQSCQCILRDTDIDKSKAHSRQKEGNYADTNELMSSIQMQIIYHIPV